MREFSVVSGYLGQFRRFFKESDPVALQVWSLWAAAVTTYTAGFLGFLYPPLAFVLLVPAGVGLLALHHSIKSIPKLSQTAKIGITLLFCTWVLHAIQIFTPESGFDALWYHLPVAQINTEAHRFFFQSALYQSANPLFSDGLFTLGFLFAGAFGTKLVAFLVAISLVPVCYKVCREFLTTELSILTTALVSTFQVIAWQSASFYVDVAVALWLCSAVWYSLLWQHDKKISRLVGVGLLIGAALGSKLFLVILPIAVLLVAVATRQKSVIKASLVVAIIAYLVALPAYQFTWQHLGHPFYSLQHHSETIAGIGAGQTLSAHITKRLQDIPHFFWQIGISRDYTTPLLLLFAPTALLAIWRKKLAQQDCLLLLASGTFLMFWWFVPPLSTRYGLAGFILATIFMVMQLHKLFPNHRKLLATTLVCATVVALLPRVYVASRSLQYLIGQQTKRQYLEQFLDGNIDSVLKKWHNQEFRSE